MKTKKNFIKKTAALAVIGTILAAGSMSEAATQNSYAFKSVNVTTTLTSLRGKKVGEVGTGANNATQEITARESEPLEDGAHCSVFFVHENAKTGKYVTMGVWITSRFGKSNSKYLSNSGVKKNTELITRVQTKKNPSSGFTKACISGSVKY